MRELSKPREEQTSESLKRGDELSVAFFQLAYTPIDQVSPSSHTYRSDAIKMMKDQINKCTTFEEHIRISHTCFIYVLVRHPFIKDWQDQADTLLSTNNAPFFYSLPSLLNFISRHLKRTEEFLMTGLYQPSNDEITTQLEQLHSRMPAVHMQLCQLLLRGETAIGRRRSISRARAARLHSLPQVRPSQNSGRKCGPRRPDAPDL